MSKITKILVANRGEIAIRIFRAASEIDIKTVAVYTHEDRYSLHRYKADEAYQIGPDDEPLKPYLDIAAIIDIATSSGADAIHPGYGFLSERPDFAKACAAAGLIWIGPSAESMDQLGDKISAKTVARRAGVPIVEATEMALTEYEKVRDAAVSIGLPVMIKAATGGGGRGMRVVRSMDDLETLYVEASREAMTAFGDPRVFVEKYIEDPKHIEVQILGDHHGRVIHLFERDCSVQRRFQKVVEVAPSIGLREDTRKRLHDYAVQICSEADYYNAGTVEFLVDEDENIYFIEVNTRIQVEHTITEVVTGIDIVRAQIMLAMGLPIDSEEVGIGDPDQVGVRGYAIQCRITTEDPANGFKPDYGRLVAYRSASGFGIRLDAGNAYSGAVISPFFDSMLVKVTAWGLTLSQSADRLHRALREFRIRGVKSNIPFLLNLLKDDNFRQGNITVNYIGRNPHLLADPGWRDRGTKLIRYIADVNINGNKDVPRIDPTVRLPDLKTLAPRSSDFRDGTKQILTDGGPGAIQQFLKETTAVQYTDTTMRDAHQSLLATRVRTIDMLRVAEAFAKDHGHEVFSMEVWGGATFDVAMRFLKESPWERLRLLRQAIPNTMLQMLLRGSNAVGYKAYPDNLIESFIEHSWETGIDVFRIFDSLNWVEALRTSITTVRERTGAIAEACICYTGDVLAAAPNRFDTTYYTDLAKRLEDAGAHMICVKDMAGLLKPAAATQLITALKASVDLPIHLHTHDTSSIQATTYLSAVEAGVDVVDVALNSMSGLTSQPGFNSFVAMTEGHPRSRPIDRKSLDRYSSYWEDVRRIYYPFETELRAGTAEVYDHEIPGGQYSNLRPQARGLGLEDQMETIKENYKAANEMLGGIVKVTPSSKVIGDMAMFMTSNGLTAEDVVAQAADIDFPDSMVALMQGHLGQWQFGWPQQLQLDILKDKQAFTQRPNAHLEPVDLEEGFTAFKAAHPEANTFEDYLSSLLYPKVFDEYYDHMTQYGPVHTLPTPAFFFGLQPNEEIIVTIGKGKNIPIQYLNANMADEAGNRLVTFRINGVVRSILVHDDSATTTLILNEKAISDKQVGSPLQGSISKILVKAGDEVEKGQPLFIIEAMKMESTITAPMTGSVRRVALREKTLVKQDDLVVELD